MASDKYPQAPYRIGPKVVRAQDELDVDDVDRPEMEMWIDANASVRIWQKALSTARQMLHDGPNDGTCWSWSPKNLMKHGIPLPTQLYLQVSMAMGLP